jgi:hypothetical protein
MRKFEDGPVDPDPEMYPNAKYNKVGSGTVIADTNKPEPVTQLLEKNHSPMIIRKYQSFGWPLFVAIICDQDLSSLDDHVIYYVNSCNPKHLNGIQDIRNFCGGLSEFVVHEFDNIKFGSVEGVAVIAYWDKCVCSSLYGDFMTHTSCRIELFSLLNMMPHV